MLGDHGMWTKMLMYEASAAIPLIMKGPDVPSGQVVQTPVSLVDCYQTIVEGVGEPLTREERALPGHSLLRIAAGDSPARTVLSEYHDGGAPTGYFMVRRNAWKYIHYTGSVPQLFNLADDPLEDEDLGQDPRYAEVRQDCEAALRAILDPVAVNRRAFAEQARKVAALGGRDALLALADSDFGFTPLKNIAGDLALAERSDLLA